MVCISGFQIRSNPMRPVSGSARSRAARLPLGVAGAVAAVSILMLVLTAAPKLAELVELHQVLAVYQEHVRQPLVRLIIGPDARLPWASGVVDALALWLSLFAAINAFVYRHEGQMLWGHIGRNYCSLEPPGVRTTLCVLPKYLLAFVATPFVLLSTMVSSVRSSHTLFTCCFVTLDPMEIVRYLRLVAMAVAAFALVLSAISFLWQ